jgi:anti-sigma B factor antagonist
VQVSIESPQAGITVLRPSGGIDMSNVPAFRQTLQSAAQQAERGLILLLSEVEFIDSSGIAVLIEGFKWSRARSIAYILAQLPPAVKMVIELARLENFFPIAESLDEATALVTETS